MVPKHELFKNIPLYIQEQNYKEGILWVGGSCWGRDTELRLVAKTWAYKKHLLQVFLITY
jgi:hypothetical protein